MTERKRILSQFNYTLEWDGGNGRSICAGFQEVSGIDRAITIAECRAGNDNDKTNEPVKVISTFKSPDVTLKRCVIDALDLYQWLKHVRQGSQAQFKTVTITLQGEDRNDVIKWRLSNARPLKYTGPSLNAKGSDVAIEELVLAVESIELE